MASNPVCLSPALLKDPKKGASPCTLHIGLGLANKIDQSMLRITGEVVTEELYRKTSVSKSPYRGVRSGVMSVDEF